MNPLYAQLGWLPRTPLGFSDLVKAAETSPESEGREIQALASFALNLNQLTKLARCIAKARVAGRHLGPLAPFRLAILSNGNMEMIAPALVASAARHGILLEVVLPEYSQVAQEALSPDLTSRLGNPDAVLFALDHRAFPLRLLPGDKETASATVNASINYIQGLQKGIKRNGNAVCIFQNLVPPVENLFGSIDEAITGTRRSLINEINRQLTDLVFASGDLLLDVAAIAETVGLANWQNPQLWNLAKFAFSDELIPLYAEHVARTLAALRGKSRKALILDLDDTVWGGVIGDDGLEGIRIAQGDPVGEAHLDVQRYALELRQRGIVLAVCSKNIDEVARKPFEQHPEMLLKPEHFAAFRANWKDKASNIQSIAEELNLGLDAMVFLDDNPVERGLVRKLLPQVAVPELPDEPAYFARTLAAAGYFEAVAFAQEDLKRAEFYEGNARRAELQNRVSDVESYLASLDMTITFEPFDAIGRARIVQLINKSNQYNLTTRRYTSPEIAHAETDPEVFTLQVRLGDIFGDNGMISVVICRPATECAWEIDTWLMSCRVLGRKVEHAVLRAVLYRARMAGISKLVGTYRPTGKNKLVADHYAKLGFCKVREEPDGVTVWELEVEGADVEPAAMKVVMKGFAETTQGLLQ